MTVAPAGPATRRWRSRAFVQPLLITVVGTWAWPALFAAGALTSPSPGLDSGCPGACGQAAFEAAMAEGLRFLAIWLAVSFAVGIVVGRSSVDWRLAGWAIVVGVMAPVVVLVWSSGMVVDGQDIDGMLGFAAVAGLILTFWVWLGSLIGTALRPG